jgi:hypothetical protein
MSKLEPSQAIDSTGLVNVVVVVVVVVVETVV